jgi:hypothetical protein
MVKIGKFPNKPVSDFAIGLKSLSLFRISIFGFRILFHLRPFDFAAQDMLGAKNFLKVPPALIHPAAPDRPAGR